MQLSAGTGKYGILQRATFLIFGDSLDHTTAFPLADMVASANAWVQKIAIWIWRASDTWEFDDSNYTTQPIATTDLVDGQQDYTLPSTALAVRRVEVKNSSGDYVLLSQIDQTEVKKSMSEFLETSGMPRFYDIIGAQLMLYPKPSASAVTLIAGLKIWIDRESTTFSVPASYTTVDTTEPGFAEPWHDLVCLGIAHDYFLGNDTARATAFLERINLAKNDLLAHYGNRNKAKRDMFVPHSLRSQGDYR